MAQLIYTTKDGDVLDAILTRQYGEGVKVMQEVLLANPGLALLGSVYRSGVKIILPEIRRENIVPTIRPWGVVS